MGTNSICRISCATIVAAPLFLMSACMTALYQSLESQAFLAPRNNIERLKHEIIPAFKRGLKESGKRRGGLVVSVGYSFKSPREEIRTSWRSLGIMAKNSWSILNPIAVEERGRQVTVEDAKRNMHFCKGWPELVKIIEQYIRAGADQIVLNSGADKKRISEFAENVLSVF